MSWFPQWEDASASPTLPLQFIPPSVVEELIGHDVPAPLGPRGENTPVVSASQRRRIVSSLPRSKFTFTTISSVYGDVDGEREARNAGKKSKRSVQCWRPRGWVCLRRRLISTICCCSHCCCSSRFPLCFPSKC